MATIAITHIGLTGHVGRATRLGAELVRQGHTVHAWAPDDHRPVIAASGAVFHAHEPLPVRSISGGGAGFAAQMAEATERHVKGLIEQLLECQAELVVYDYNAPWGRVAADFLGLPRIGSYPLFPAVLAELDPGEEPSSGERGTRSELVPAFPPGWQHSVARAEASRRAILHHWGVDLRPSHEPPQRAEDWAVSFTTPELAGHPRVPGHWRFLGPLLGSRPARPAATRGDEPPLVYVSLGTFFNFVGAVYAAVIEALAGEPVEVVISTGRGVLSPAELQPLPENITAYEHVAARDLLDRAAVTVTHCGINSVHEALMAGVPMVCLPQAADQFGWANRVEQLGAGRAAKTDPSAIRAAVRWLLEDERPRTRARELGRQLAAYDGPGEVARLVQAALDDRPR